MSGDYGIDYFDHIPGLAVSGTRYPDFNLICHKNWVSLGITYLDSNKTSSSSWLLVNPNLLGAPTRWSLTASAVSAKLYTEAGFLMLASVCSSLLSCLLDDNLARNEHLTFCFKSTFCSQIVSCYKNFVIK